MASCAGWPGIAAARQAVDLADGRAESVLESRSRAALHGRLPQPDLQTEIYDEYGRLLARLDMFWDRYGVAGEVDGLAKYTSARDLRLEKIRQDTLEETGLIIVRWGHRHLEQPEALVARLQRAFERGLQPGRSRNWWVRPNVA